MTRRYAQGNDILKRRRNVKKAVFSVFTILGFILLAVLSVMQISLSCADKEVYWRPEYPMENIEPLLRSASPLSDADYEKLYAQTGLTRVGVDRMRSEGKNGIVRILEIQKSYFAERETVRKPFGLYMCTDHVDSHVPVTYLENGDILVTASTHIGGWRIGHAGLVVNGASGEVLQAESYGQPSIIKTTRRFTDRINFLVLSPKDKKLGKNVADYAVKNLVGIDYSSLIGIFRSKNSIDYTHCSHLVWYAYNHFGVDLDSNGGTMVMSKDIANSPHLEVVQVFGFDPDKLWK